MYSLIYRDGAPENTGHYEGFEKATGTDKELHVGQLVSVSSGVASAYASGKPYGVVAREATADDDSVLVLRITDDMIFKTKLTTGNTSALKKNGQLKVSVSGVTSETAADVAFEITDIISDTVVEGRFVTIA